MDAITIVGGGIAGLALAARLDPDRFEVTLHEQREGTPPVETSLAMWPEALRALEAVGILPAVRDAGSRFEGMALRDGRGKPWTSASVPGVVGVSRRDLMRQLDGAVPASVRRVAGRVEALPGSALVIGADGVHSVVRRALWGVRTKARLTPYLALRGVVDEPVSTETGGEYWGRGELFGITPAARGRTYWYASFRSGLGPGGIDAAEALALARARYAGRAPGIGRVLAAATPEGTLAQRIWTVPWLRSYTRPGAALVGDAAHGMTPNLGRGACEALIDAVSLADLLNSRPRRPALTAYDRRRVLRTQALRVASAAMTRLALAERGQPVRDRILDLAGRRTRSAEPV